MTIATIVQNAASGDNTTTHALTAATVGTFVSEILTWGLQVAHLNPPTSVDEAINGLCMVGASLLMQKLFPSQS